jgi:ribosomal protein L11 methyltransferase
LGEFPALDLQWKPADDTAELVELLYALLDEFAPQAIHDHESGDGWRVFFKTPLQRDTAVDALTASLGERLVDVSAADVADEEWARRSQANLNPIRVGRIVVAPPWHAPNPVPTGYDLAPVPLSIRHSADLLIVIDPSTGFGTGHHETTRLCLSLLQGIDLSGRTVIDVGTGSGVLAIAAAKLGASSVVAIDEDPEALRNARENVTRNDAENVIDVREADLGSFESDPVDVVVANLTGSVIQRHACRLTAVVKAGGRLIVSGFNLAEAANVTRALARTAERELTEGDWEACLFHT